MREILYREGKFDTTIAPGMVVPVDLPANISLRTPQHDQRDRPRAPGRDARRRRAAEARRLHGEVLAPRREHAHDQVRQRAVEHARVLRHRAARDRHPEARRVSRQPSSAHRSRRSGTSGMYSDWDQKNEIRRSPEDRDSLSAWLTDAERRCGQRAAGVHRVEERVPAGAERRSTASSSTSASTSGAGCR